MLYLVFMLDILTMVVTRYSPNYAKALEFRGEMNSPNETKLLVDLVMLDAPSLIKTYGYPVETHHVVTADGYILEAHRIPPNRTVESRTVVFAMHGLLASSADFIAQGPHKALGCVLADEGYDVWLGNNRGNYYSREHVRLDPDKEDKFWNYSWEEIGYHDLAAFTDYILTVTNQTKIHFIGHSQGATAFIVLNSLRSEYNDKFKSFLAMAPAVYFEHNNAPYINSIARLEGVIKLASDYAGVKEIAPRNCNTPSSTFIEKILCLVIRLQDLKNINPKLLPLLKAHTPAGASIRQFVHYAQCIRYKSFRRMNYDTYTNLRLYNSVEPPGYNVSKVTVPTAIYMGISDTYVNYKDLMNLANDLPNATIHQVDDPNFGHSGFLWHTDAKSLLYDNMLQVLNLFEAGNYSEVKNQRNEMLDDNKTRECDP